MVLPGWEDLGKGQESRSYQEHQQPAGVDGAMLTSSMEEGRAWEEK
jgi:hypothetical protein